MNGKVEKKNSIASQFYWNGRTFFGWSIFRNYTCIVNLLYFYYTNQYTKMPETYLNNTFFRDGFLLFSSIEFEFLLISSKNFQFLPAISPANFRRFFPLLHSFSLFQKWEETTLFFHTNSTKNQMVFFIIFFLKIN